ncbi:MAG: TAXI family TRAP transporter solute-binding subunit [Gaiellales bacterium]|nr:TAXI family TRAP transporter solute-binding subunit [Gaiellales bacterium]
MNIKKVLPLLAALILACAAVVVTGCGTETTTTGAAGSSDVTATTGAATETTQTPSSGSKNISIGTSGPGGTFYPIGIGIAEAMTRDMAGVTATAETTAGSIENIRLLKAGKLNFGLAPLSTAIPGFEGTAPFDAPMDIRIVGTLYSDALVLIVKKGSIASVADLKGKKVAVGKPGDGVETAAQALLAGVGLSYDDISEQFIGGDAASSALVDGTIDAMFELGAHPMASVVELSQTADIDLVSVDRSILEKIIAEKPQYVISTAEVGVYSGIDYAVDNLGNVAALITGAAEDEQTVYEAAKAVYAHGADIAQVHPAGAQIAAENGLQAKGIVDYHPGAIKFFTEEGLWK